MMIAIASGKGGTGKTTVVASLAWVWREATSPDPGRVTAVDMDVEEPNLHLFLRPEITDQQVAEIVVPQADESKCTFCRLCAEICQFKAITVWGEHILIFPEMCHGCGGCLAVCDEEALTPGARKLGQIFSGHLSRDTGQRIEFLMGRLRSARR
jgi:MinD superfamily P-loop ATPase